MRERDYATAAEWQAYEDGMEDMAAEMEPALVAMQMEVEGLRTVQATAGRRDCRERACVNSIYARGWCAKHYNKFYVNPSVCCLPACGRPVRTRKLCETHYKSFMRAYRVSPERAEQYLRLRSGDDPWSVISQVMQSGRPMNLATKMPSPSIASPSGASEQPLATETNVFPA